MNIRNVLKHVHPYSTNTHTHNTNVCIIKTPSFLLNSFGQHTPSSQATYNQSVRNRSPHDVSRCRVKQHPSIGLDASAGRRSVVHWCPAHRNRWRPSEPGRGQRECPRAREQSGRGVTSKTPGTKLMCFGPKPHWLRRLNESCIQVVWIYFGKENDEIFPKQLDNLSDKIRLNFIEQLMVHSWYGALFAVHLNSLASVDHMCQGSSPVGEIEHDRVLGFNMIQQKISGTG